MPDRPTTWYDDGALELGTEGTVRSGTRRGLPDHLDGIPVAPTWRAMVLPRRSWQPLPMAELRSDGDAGNIGARWPEPFSAHDLDRRPE